LLRNTAAESVGLPVKKKYEDQFYCVVYLFMQYLFFVSAKWSTERFSCYCECYHSYCVSER